MHSGNQDHPEGHQNINGARDVRAPTDSSLARNIIFAVGLSALAGFGLFALWQHNRPEVHPMRRYFLPQT